MHWKRLVRAVVAFHRRIQYDMSGYKVTMLRVGRTSDSACLSADLPEGSHQAAIREGTAQKQRGASEMLSIRIHFEHVDKLLRKVQAGRQRSALASGNTTCLG
jgi:hypothetical protein